MQECFERAAGVFICVVGVFRNLDVHGLLRAHMCESRNEKNERFGCLYKF